jgi:UDP-glucose-4-epimerase GalE
MSLNVIVTGGAGYIGSHTCKLLRESGFNPIVIDNLYRGHRRHVNWGPLEVGDIRDRQFLEGVFVKYSPVAVMHFAALAYVEESMQKPDEYNDVNVNGSRQLISTMKKFNCKMVIFSSSCAVYGNVASGFVDEALPLEPINPYGQSKKKVEIFLREGEVDFALRHVSLRYFNAVGADPSGEIGELHLPETHIIPLAFEAIENNMVFKIYGVDYETPDGTCVRDLIHVNDLARAHLLALNYLINSGESSSINLGSGQGLSILELLDAIEKITKS